MHHIATIDDMILNAILFYTGKSISLLDKMISLIYVTELGSYSRFNDNNSDGSSYTLLCSAFYMLKNSQKATKQHLSVKIQYFLY